MGDLQKTQRQGHVLSNVDTLLTPFIRYDGLIAKEIKQVP